MEQTFVNTVLPKLGLHLLLGMQKPPLWFSYDREGDVLHVVFKEAKTEDETILNKDDIIVARRGKTIINMTILNASRLFHQNGQRSKRHS